MGRLIITGWNQISQVGEATRHQDLDGRDGGGGTRRRTGSSSGRYIEGGGVISMHTMRHVELGEFVQRSGKAPLAKKGSGGDKEGRQVGAGWQALQLCCEPHQQKWEGDDVINERVVGEGGS